MAFIIPVLGICPPRHKSVKVEWSQKVIVPSSKFVINSVLNSLSLYSSKASAFVAERILNSCFSLEISKTLSSTLLKSASVSFSSPKSTS